MPADVLPATLTPADVRKRAAAARWGSPKHLGGLAVQKDADGSWSVVRAVICLKTGEPVLSVVGTHATEQAAEAAAKRLLGFRDKED